MKTQIDVKKKLGVLQINQSSIRVHFNPKKLFPTSVSKHHVFMNTANIADSQKCYYFITK